YRKDGHRFRRTVHTGSPALTEQQKDRRNQRTGVTDTYPPYEIGDIPSPTYSAVNTPHTDSVIHFPEYREYAKQQEQNGKEETDIPHAAWLLFYRANDIFRYLMVCFLSIDQRFPYKRFVLQMHST